VLVLYLKFWVPNLFTSSTFCCYSLEICHHNFVLSLLILVFMPPCSFEQTKLVYLIVEKRSALWEVLIRVVGSFQNGGSFELKISAVTSSICDLEQKL